MERFISAASVPAGDETWKCVRFIVTAEREEEESASAAKPRRRG